MSLPTIADSRIAAPLYAIIVRVELIPAKTVLCLGRKHSVPAELLTWRLPVGQDPFNHKEEIKAHRRTCEHFNTTLLGDGRTCCTADLRALPTWQDPGGDGMIYPCGDDCPFMKQFINEDKDEDIETNHSDGRA